MADVELLFGVAGGASLGGESGKAILNDLTEIVKKINENPLRVKFQADENSLKAIREQIQAIAKGIGAGVVTVGGAGAEEIKERARAVDELRKSVESAAAAGGKSFSLDRALTQLDTLSARVQATMKKLADFAPNTSAETMSKNLAGVAGQLDALKARLQSGTMGAEEYRAAWDKVRLAASTALNEIKVNLGGKLPDNMKRLTVGTKEYEAALSKISSAISKITERQAKWSGAKHGVSKNSYAALDNVKQSLSALYNEVATGNVTVKNFDDSYKSLMGTFEAESRVIQMAGDGVLSFGDKFKMTAKTFGAWFSSTRILLNGVRAIRAMIDTTVELDSAFTQLQIVTGATDAQMESFADTTASLSQSLGKSMTDVAASIETFSRLGYSLGEASQLAEYATILSNVAAVSTEEATTGITSIIKGFNLDVEDVSHVADILVEVGQKYAVSASEMMEAYEKSGAALSATNTSLEKSAGLIAAANASVQNASTVGTALKTVSARIRGSKTDLEELGEATDDLANGFSKYAQEIQALTGFNIMVEGTTDEFKDLYDIFEGIAQVWDKLSDTQQARVAEILGGTRQLQVISSIIGNWGDAASAYATAMNSAGAATKANDVYMSSAAAHIAQFKAQIQELSSAVVNSDFLDFFIQLGTGVAKLATGLAKVGALLPGIAALFSTIRTISGAKLELEGIDNVRATFEMLDSGQITVAALKARVDALTLSEKRNMRSKIDLAVAGGSLNAERAKEIIETLGLTDAILNLNGAQKKATFSAMEWGAAIKASIASNPVGWIITLIGVVVELGYAIAKNVKTAKEKLEELDSEFEELSTTIQSAADGYAQMRQSAEDVIPRFAELSRGVNEFGDNTGLTNEEYSEFWRLNDQIAQMFPEINSGFYSNGHAMLTLSYNAENLTQKLWDLVEAQRASASAEIAGTMPDVMKNIQKSMDVYRNEIDKTESRLAELKQIYDKIINQEVTPEGAWAIGSELIEAAGIDMEALPVTELGAPYFDDDSREKLDEAYREMQEEERRLIEQYRREMQGEWQKLNPVVGAWLQTDFNYQELAPQLQEVVTTMVTGIDWAALGLETAEQVEDYIRDNVIMPIYDASPEARAAFTELFSQYEAGLISAEEFSAKMGAILTEIFGGSNLRNRLVQTLRETGVEVNSLAEAIAYLINQWLGVAPAEQTAGDALNSAKESIGSLTDSVKTLSGAWDILEAAQKDMSDGGGLSAETIEKIKGATEDYIDYLYVENGAVKLNTEAWNDYIEAQRAAAVAELERQRAALEAERNTRAAGGDDTSEYEREIERVNRAIEVYTALSGEAKGATTDLADSVSEVSKAYSALEKAMSDMESGGLSVDTIKALSEANEDYIDFLYVENGVIKLNTEAWIAYAESVRAAKIEELEQQKVDLEAQKVQKNRLMSVLIDYRRRRRAYEGIGDTENAQRMKEMADNAYDMWKELDAIDFDSEIARVEHMIDVYGAIDFGNLGGSDGGSGSGGGGGSAKTWFDEQYAYHKHLLAMEQESESEYLSWLDGAYQKAYAQGIITLDDYYKYQEEVYDGLKSLGEENARSLENAAKESRDSFLKSLDESEARIEELESAGGSADSIAEIYRAMIEQIDAEIARQRQNGLSEEDEYLADLLERRKEYAQAVGETYEQAEQSRRDAFEGALDDTEFTISGLEGTSGSGAQIIAYYRQMIDAIDGELARARAQGLDETDDYIQELLKRQRGYFEEIAAIEEETEDAAREALADSLGDREFNIEMRESAGASSAEIIAIYQGMIDDIDAEIARARANGLTEEDEYLQELLQKRRGYADDIVAIQEEAEQKARDAYQSAIDYDEFEYEMLEKTEGGYNEMMSYLLDAQAKTAAEIRRAYAQGLDEHDEYLQGLLLQHTEYTERVAELERQTIDGAKSYIESIEGKAEFNLEYLDEYASEYPNAMQRKLHIIDRTISTIQKEIDDLLASGVGTDDPTMQWLYEQLWEWQEKEEDLRKETEDAAKESFGKIIDWRVDMLKQEIEDERDAYKEQKEAEKEALQERLDALHDFYDEQREALKDQLDEEKYLEDQAEKRKNVADIEAELAALRTDNSAWAQKRRAELEAELAEANKDLSDFERDHAYDVTIEELDKAEEEQTSRIEAMVEALDEEMEAQLAVYEERLGDAGALYKQALNDVRDGSIDLFEDMVAWNAKYGDGIRQTIVDAWKEAYAAGEKYFQLFGTPYEGITMSSVFSEDGRPKPRWGYARGTGNASRGLHRIDERGEEMIFKSASGAKYKMFTGGEKVLDARASDFLYKFANGSTDVLRKVFREMTGGAPGNLSGAVNNNAIRMGDIVINGAVDKPTVSEIRRAQRDQVTFMLNEFRKLR